ncbi:hypothetical protein LJB80_01180 [Bacteroides sp. OttesenSCG-928-F21]|nr:hypothetical protein [Bacteroides sp. OttesenSCG-928-F21]
MEELIKKTVGKLKSQFILFWVLPLLLLILFETECLPTGVYADNDAMKYLVNTASILLTVLIVPLSLKYFSRILKKKIDQLPVEEAIAKYGCWSNIRLGLLGFVVLLGLIAYYLTFENIGSLCALIALTASLFCMPGERKLREELHISEEKEEP